MISEVDLRDWGYVPKRPIESREQYVHYLRNHDWFFEMTESPKVWKDGRDVLTYLYEAQKQFDPTWELWKRYDPI